jgi:hypothetical protein
MQEGGRVGGNGWGGSHGRGSGGIGDQGSRWGSELAWILISGWWGTVPVSTIEAKMLRKVKRAPERGTAGQSSPLLP